MRRRPDTGNEWIPSPQPAASSTARGSSRRYEPIQSVEFYAVEKPADPSAAPTAGRPRPEPEATQWHAVYYDSPRSLTPKLALADARGLAGAGFWAIGFERGAARLRRADPSFREGRGAGRRVDRARRPQRRTA